jgi:hypothetical protein
MGKELIAPFDEVLRYGASAQSNSAPLGKTPRHSPECVCLFCERSESGLFAQKSLLAGDFRAADRLSGPVSALLANQCPKFPSRRRHAQ